tara:strand:+ start:2448 stop:3362 length:915 start_codon:yes stop_codon:yes gene_type:complete
MEVVVGSNYKFDRLNRVNLMNVEIKGKELYDYVKERENLGDEQFFLSAHGGDHKDEREFNADYQQGPENPVDIGDKIPIFLNKQSERNPIYLFDLQLDSNPSPKNSIGTHPPRVAGGRRRQSRRGESRTMRKKSRTMRRQQRRGSRTVRRQQRRGTPRRSRTARRQQRRVSPRKQRKVTRTNKRNKRRSPSRKVRVVSDILSSSYGVKSKPLAPSRQSSMDEFLAGISSSSSVVSDQGSYDLDAWMTGKKSKKSKKSKKKRSKKSDTSGPYHLDKLFKEPKKPKSKKKRSKKRSKKSGGFFGLF